MSEPTIYEELQAQHAIHRDLLARIDGAGEQQAGLFEEFRIAVSAHAAAEEQTLYAVMLADPDLQAEARHSVSEHKEIEDFLAELCAAPSQSDDWSEKFDVMRKRYLHHIDEEEREMFPEAHEKLPNQVETELAGRFEERNEAEREKAAEIDPSEQAGRE